MKNRLPKEATAKQTKKPRGRFGKTWFSPEFIAWCRQHHFKPEGVAACVLHTYALKHPRAEITIVNYEGPVGADDIYDLPAVGGQQEAP